MRKITVILLCALICLLCSKGGASEYVPVGPLAPTALSFDHSTSDEWLCEWEYNSDLGLTRILAETPGVSVPSLSLRDGRSILRTGIKCGVACGHEGYSVIAISEFGFNNISAGMGGVDYYVYRLRRLII